MKKLFEKHRMILVLILIVLALGVYNFSQHYKIQNLREENYQKKYEIYQAKEELRKTKRIINSLDDELDSLKSSGQLDQ
jgi:predicted Holliday junction resolvase-like endonuclease